MYRFQYRIWPEIASGAAKARCNALSAITELSDFRDQTLVRTSCILLVTEV